MGLSLTQMLLQVITVHSIRGVQSVVNLGQNTEQQAKLRQDGQGVCMLPWLYVWLTITGTVVCESHIRV